MRPNHYSLVGTPYLRGKKWGEVAGNDIKALIEQDKYYIFTAPIARNNRDNRWRHYYDIIASYLPETADFLHGIAEGAGCDMQDIIALQCRRELSMPGDDCSLFAQNNADNSFIVQTIDLAKYSEPYGCLLHELDEEKKTRSLMYTLTGLAGYAGINGYGLAVGINMVRSSDWQPGIPPYLLVRHLLSLKTVEACLAELERLPRASSRCLTLLQGNNLTTVEMMATQLRYWRQQNSTHTNHYLHPDYLTVDAQLKTDSTEERLFRLNYLISQTGYFTQDKILATLSDHVGEHGAICCHGRQPLDAHTIAGIVLMPRQGKIAAVAGNPCQSHQFHEFIL
ncbi:C45 family autoproteolytic acyltransferase/hydolase [Pectobacterium aquaticum]|uniref:C45 family autoproteolytic acyltransferase/hydolase n=1 Tax=Pectobacterium aquaticum TaxID=2204145 RepID=UPI000E26970B|nr:C45 family peptidase [Pectobacterium aquaticum]UEM39393.1 C45 family autoproteolytic acyltransferase/hydrolase [Pectobacterium aquaticum]